MFALAAWNKAAGLVHQWNSEKTVSKPTPQFILSLITLVWLILFIFIILLKPIRLAEVERQLEAEKLQRSGATSSATRMRLAEVERELAGVKASTASSKTKNLLEEKMRELQLLQQGSKTSTRTREMLAQVNKKIAEEKKKMTSSNTRSEYERQQAMLRQGKIISNKI